MQKKGALWSLLLLVFIDLIGVGIVIPVLPALFFNGVLFGPSVSMATRGILLGLLVAAYPLAQFFGAPIIGSLSDMYGRKKMLILSIAGTVIGYILLALGIIYSNLWLLFISRILDGFTGGNISIVRSAIADISTPQEKTKNFGLIGMMFGIGFIIGPFLGGKLTDNTLVSWFTYATPFWFAAILSFVNLILIMILFTETLQHPRKRKLSLFSGLSDVKKGFTSRDLRGIFISSFLVFFGWSFFTQFFQVFLIDRFLFTPSNIGSFFAYTGLWIAITQAVIVRNVATRVEPIKVLRYSIFGLGGTLLFFLIPHQSGYLYLITPFIAVFFGFMLPNLTTILSNAVSPQEQGEILGIQQSMFSLAQAIPPLIAGVSIAFATYLPIVLASLFILAGWLVFPKKVKHYSQAL